ncbi:alpha/beta hydrolase [Microlunatus speluncae]|uniref:alpha/beta hydrolase n=1 Tax=Microlunatus speluncae TaxID=2594267 RepID=UPI0012664E0B|nr:alpha/beta hydrolase [Microlunatus speluncae]
MTMRKRTRRLAALAIAAGIAAAAFVTPGAYADQNDGPGDGTAALAWGACPEGTAPTNPLLECATLPVPLDYDDPDGRTIDIMISRLPSQNPEERRGILITNPGGPGGSGLSMPADLQALGAPSSLLDSYDIIGLDPRGVGHSSPVSCGFTTDQEYLSNIPQWAADADEVDHYAEVVKGVAEQCAAADTEGLLPHISSANTARDLEQIRAAFGEDKINFFGVSYGSALGGTYASLFPEQTDRMIIDSNVGGTAFGRDAFRRMARGAEEGFGTFAGWAAARHDSYGLGRTERQVRQTWFRLADQLDAEPVIGINGKLFRLISFGMLYKEDTFPTLAQLWQSLAQGDEAAVRSYLANDAPASIRAAGTGSENPQPSPSDNVLSSFLAVTCNDSQWSRDVASYQQSVAEDREKYPLFGAAAANITPCAFWPHDGREVELVDEGPENILIMQNRIDVATPYIGGVLARKGFGDRSRLVSVDGYRHGVYLFDDNPCALNVGTAYLVDGEFPRRDVRCAAERGSGLALTADQLRLRERTLDRLTPLH